MNDSAELARQVQELLDSYVKRAIALDALQDALDNLAPRLAELPDEKYAAWAVDHVEILIAELLRRDRSEDEVRKLIRDEVLLPSVEIVDATSASLTATETSTTSRSVLASVA